MSVKTVRCRWPAIAGLLQFSPSAQSSGRKCLSVSPSRIDERVHPAVAIRGVAATRSSWFEWRLRRCPDSSRRWWVAWRVDKAIERDRWEAATAEDHIRIAWDMYKRQQRRTGCLGFRAGSSGAIAAGRKKMGTSLTMSPRVWCE